MIMTLLLNFDDKSLFPPTEVFVLVGERSGAGLNCRGQAVRHGLTIPTISFAISEVKNT
jgi:hypothetical protein